MSIEVKELAERINNFNVEAELSTDPKVFEEGNRDYNGILLKITFILPVGLRKIPNYLNEKGKLAYDKYFKAKIDYEIKNQNKIK